MTEMESPHPAEATELRWKHTERGLDEAEMTLGITPDVIDSWKQNNTQILEVGTGKGYLMKDLVDAGIPANNIKGLEPGLSFEKPPEVINDLRESLAEKGLTESILPNTAAEAPNVMEKNSIDVAIALGPNFQNFSRSEADILRQIKGLSEVVKPGGKIIFETELTQKEGDEARPFVQYGQNSIDTSKQNLRKFDLGLALDGSGIKYDITNNRGGISGAIEISVAEDTPQKLQQSADVLSVLEDPYPGL